MNIDELQTGDLVLVTGRSTGVYQLFLDMIMYGTHSSIVHIGIIIKDPEFTETPMKGTFFWESGFEGTPDPQDGKIKLGVQLTSIEELIDSKNSAFYVRRFNDNSVFNNTEKLKQIHRHVYCKPYDINPRDWLYALFRKDIEPQKTDRFWCSAFVGYVLTQLGLLSGNTDWSTLYPSDFALDSEKLNYSSENKLMDWEYKLHTIRGELSY